MSDGAPSSFYSSMYPFVEATISEAAFCRFFFLFSFAPSFVARPPSDLASMLANRETFGSNEQTIIEVSGRKKANHSLLKSFLGGRSRGGNPDGGI